MTCRVAADSYNALEVRSAHAAGTGRLQQATRQEDDPLVFDLSGGRSQIDIAANGAVVGTCPLGTAPPCEVILGPAVLRDGVNALTMSGAQTGCVCAPARGLFSSGANQPERDGAQRLSDEERCT